MEKVVVSLWRGEEWSFVGLSIRNEEGDEELRELIKIAEEGIAKHFPHAQIVRRKAARELCGE